MTDVDITPQIDRTGSDHGRGPLAHIFIPATGDKALCGHKRRHEIDQTKKHDVCVVCKEIFEQRTGRPL